MTVPTHHQVFADHVTPEAHEVEHLTPFLTGWTRLAKEFPKLTERELRCLVILELSGARRRVILGRLVARLTRLERRRVEARIASVTGKPQTGWWRKKEEKSL